MISRFRTPSQSLADEELVARVARGDSRAFEALYDRHERPAYSLALRLLADSDAAEDVVQDAFLAVWQRVEKYDPSRGSFRTWLLTTIHSRGIDRLRSRAAQQRRREALEGEAGAASEAAAATPLPGETRALAASVRGDLAELPPAQREVIVLAYYGGLTHREISEYLEVPIGTVKSRIRLGMSGLRDRIGALR